MQTPRMPPRDEMLAGVMATYGTTMLCAQTFEKVLACLVTVVDLRRSSGAKAPIEKRLAKQAKRVLHRFHKASAAELVNMLRGDVSDELLSEIEPLIEWRNFLAHSYLTARLTYPQAWADGRAELRPDAAHVVELMQLAMAYRDATAHVTAAIETVVRLNAGDEWSSSLSGAGAPLGASIGRRALGVHQDHFAQELGVARVHSMSCLCRPFVPARARAPHRPFHL